MIATTGADGPHRGTDYNGVFPPTATRLKKSDFHYELPPELIAQQPLRERSASRLLLLDVPHRAWQDRAFRELPSLLRAGAGSSHMPSPVRWLRAASPPTLTSAARRRTST